MSYNTQYGYLIGGNVLSAPYATIEKILFSTGANTFLGNSALESTLAGSVGISNSVDRGYLVGGYKNLSYSNSVSKFSYFVDTVSTVSAQYISSNKAGMAGIDGDSTKGYVAGGYGNDPFPTSPANTLFDNTDKFTYSTETAQAVTSADLGLPRYFSASASDNSTKGYVLGGITALGFESAITQWADVIDYSSDTSSAVTTANLQVGRSQMSSLANTGIAAYFCAGLDGFVLNYTEKLNFSTDTTFYLTSSIPTMMLVGASGVSGQGKGLIAGGLDYSQEIPYFAIQKHYLDFSTENFVYSDGNYLQVPRYNMASFSMAIAYKQSRLQELPHVPELHFRCHL
jgi:hypothetical protein